MDGSRLPKRAAATAAFGFIVLAALTGGAGTGGAAATALTVTVIDQLDPISSGGTVGYAAKVHNTGASTVTQVAFVLETSLAGEPAGTYRASAVTQGSATCTEGPTANSMRCTTSRLAPDESFTVTVAFKAPAVQAESSLTAIGKATVSAQTEGTPGNKGTSTWFAEPPAVTTVLEPSNLSVSTFSLPNDSVSTGSLLTTALGFPAAFSNGHFGLATGISEFSGDPLCDKCPAVFSNVSIPASLTDQNPFSLSNPYTFTMTLAKAAQPPGYKLNGLVHLEDDSSVWKAVPLCASVTLSPDDPVCLDAAPSQNKKSGVITATGRGIENGNWGFD
jgi:hypothetical protein